MKTCALGFMLLALPLYAEDLKLTTGAEYKNVRVSRVEPDGIVIATETGVVKLFFTELPKEVQEKYHFDPKAAEAFRFRLDAARDAAADEVAAAKQREAEHNVQSATTSEVPVAPSTNPRFDPRLLKSLSLSAHEIGTADGYQSYWETDWGSYDRDYARGKRILVTLRDTSRKVPKCQIDVYFVARPVLDPYTHFIYDHRRLFPHLRGRLEINGPVAAVDLHARMTNFAALGRFYSHGADMDGWIVIGSVDDQVFGMAASSRTLEAIARGDPNQPERLSDMVNGYQSLRD